MLFRIYQRAEIPEPQTEAFGSIPTFKLNGNSVFTAMFANVMSVRSTEGWLCTQ